MERISNQQKKLLIRLIDENLQFINGRFQSAQGAQFTHSVWEKIHEKLNAIGPKKTILQWKKCWKDLRLGVKAKATKLRQYRTATGGGEPSNITFTDEEEIILRMVGIEGFDGLPDIQEGGLNMVTPPLMADINSNTTISFGPEDFEMDMTLPSFRDNTLPSTSGTLTPIISYNYQFTPTNTSIPRNTSTPIQPFAPILTPTPILSSTPIVTSAPVNTTTTNTRSILSSTAVTRPSSTENISPHIASTRSNDSNPSGRRNPYLGNAVNKSMNNQATTIELLQKILEVLQTANTLLDKIEKGLNEKQN